MGHAKFVDEALQTVRFIDGIEVFALDVFDQTHRRHRIVGHFAQQHRHFVQPGQPRRPPAPLPRNDLEPIRDFARQDRLHQTLRADRVGQLLQRFTIHLRARLIFAGRELRHVHHAQFALWRRGVVLAAEQCVESAS